MQHARLEVLQEPYGHPFEDHLHDEDTREDNVGWTQDKVPPSRDFSGEDIINESLYSEIARGMHLINK